MGGRRGQLVATLAVVISLLAADNPADPNSKTKERHQQARDDDEMRQTVALRIACFPGADEEVEGEVVDPTGQQYLRFLEQRGYVCERTEAAFSAALPLRLVTSVAPAISMR